MSDEVMTVLGPVSSEQLGVTLCHEHVFIDLWTEFGRDGVLNDLELAVAELAPFSAAGGRTVVDCSTDELGRNPQGLAEISRRTGLQIVMGTGHYRHPYLDRAWFDRNDPDRIAEIIVSDLQKGVGETGIRAGIIGEIASEREWIAAAEERSFRGAARAHLATGITITTHAAGWPVGLKQLSILESEGVSPDRVIIGHCDTVPDMEYHLELARRGAFVQFDTIRDPNEYELASREKYVCNLIEHGHLHQILLSQDICLRQHLAVRGGGGYGFVLSRFVPQLRERGLSEDDVHTLLVDNPRRALTGERAAAR
jgi:phosphotriesterase-related protein